MSLTLVDFVKQQEPLFIQADTDERMVWAKESQFAIQLFQNNDYLAKVAFQNLTSTQNAIINVAAIGISLNPAQKLAYTVPRKGAICLDISYMGLMHIAQQSGAIKWCQSAIVRRIDQFRREGLDKPPIHIYNDFDTEEQRGDIVGAYVTVKLTMVITSPIRCASMPSTPSVTGLKHGRSTNLTTAKSVHGSLMKNR